MSEYQIYLSDVWDYLSDMPYMPSRQNRDELIQAGDYKRVQIWDYFFRIDPDDVGKPQKIEMSLVDSQLSEEILKHNQKKHEVLEQIAVCNTKIIQKKMNCLYIGIGGLFFAAFCYYFINYYGLSKELLYLCVIPLLLLGSFSLGSRSFIGWSEKRMIRNLQFELLQLLTSHDDLVRKGVNRKNVLRNEIKLLKKQIPTLPSDIQVREWLRQDFVMLWNKSKDVTALSNRLINIESNKIDQNGNPMKFPNPVAVVGPAELQRSERLPLIFTRSVDLSKHFSARRSFYMINENRVEVLYGVYYLEHILIADDMLATYGLFYDFITGKFHSEEITEQYYKDVVAISTTHEFREITLGIGDKESKYVEDAPTFTLSLASGEHRTVTFVSEKYFMEIKEKINLNEADVLRIYWILDAQENANMAVGALRARLRLHKETHDEKEN